MLLDEDPATLINHTLSNFNIRADRLAISRVTDTLSSISSSRSLQTSALSSQLSRLRRTETSLSSSHAETLSTYSPSTHASAISSLDSEKFRLAKTSQTLESGNERLASTLLDLESKLQELEVQGVDGGEGGKRLMVEDEVLLKLRIYRSLGLEKEVKNDEDGKKEGVDKVVVKRKGGVHVVNVDSNSNSRYFYANYLWGLIGEEKR